MPTYDLTLFSNKPRRKAFLNYLHNPRLCVQLSERCLNKINTITLDAIQNEKEANKNIFEGEMYRLEREARLSHYLAKMILNTHILLLGQRQENKNKIIQFYTQSLMKILSAIYADIYPGDDLTALENKDYHAFLSECLIESMTSCQADQVRDFLSDLIVSSTMLQAVMNHFDLFNISIGALFYISQQLQDEVKSFFCNQLDLILKENANDAKLRLTDEFNMVEEKTLQKLSGMFISHPYRHAAKYFLRLLLVVLPLVVVATTYFPELIASVNGFIYMLALCVSALACYGLARVGNCEIKEDYLLNLFKRATANADSLYDMLKLQHITLHDHKEWLPLYDALQDYTRRVHRHDKRYFMALCQMLRCMNHLKMSAYAFKKEDIILPNKKHQLRLIRHYSENTTTSPQPTLTALKKSKGARVQSTTTISRTIEAKHPIDYLLPEELKGTVIQGDNVYNKNSAIYVEFPKAQPKHQGRIQEIRDGHYSFCAPKAKNGFKYISDTQDYRFKLFDKEKTRWMFRRVGEISVGTSNGETKNLPHYRCYLYGTK